MNKKKYPKKYPIQTFKNLATTEYITVICETLRKHKRNNTDRYIRNKLK